MISKEQVRNIAKLARLKLGDEEVKQYQRDLNEVLQAAEKLQQIDTSEVSPTTSVIGADNVLREDEAKSGLPQAEVHNNGPQVVQGYFRVPRVMEGE